MKAYRLLLLLYPASFRHHYGEEMAAAFAALHERVRREEGAAGLVLLWLRTVADAGVSGTRERLRGADPLFHLRHAWRSLRRAPGYATAFVLTLGLAIGVNSAVFSVVNGVLLKPLPFEGADRILYLKQPVTRAGVENTTFSFIEIDDYRAASTAVDELVEFGDWDFSVVGQGEAHRAVGGLVTSNYFDVLSMQTSLGRTLEAEDDRPDAEPVTVLTHAYWTRVFGADPGVVGRLVELSGVRTRVVGVLEPGLHYTDSRRPDLYANYTTNAHYQGAAMRDSRTHRMTDLFARLAPGAELEAAREELRGVAERLHREHPAAYPAHLGFDLEVVRWQEELTRRARPVFLLLMGTVGAVLLLACANVANLTLTRLLRRERELATRKALGASGRNLRLHVAAENALLGLAGAALGLGLAVLSRDALTAYAARYTVRAQEVGVDWTVLAATLLGALTIAVALAWFPGLPIDPTTSGVAGAASRSTHGRARKRLQRGLVVAQLSLSFTLLAGAGLLVRSLLTLSDVDPGFRTERVLTMEAPGGNFASLQDDGAVFREVLERLRELPGVRSVAVATWAPLTGQDPVAFDVRVEGSGDAGGQSHPIAFNSVSSGYADVLGLRMESGRFIGPLDAADTDSVIVVNRSLAEVHFGGEDPVGRRISFSFDGTQWTPWLRIVGVVADSREHGLEAPTAQTVYRTAEQSFWGPTVLVATRGDPVALVRGVKDVIHDVDPTRPVDHVRTMEELRAEEVAPSRLNALLFGAFAALAVVIAAVGVLGVLAFSVSERVREFGVRMALGAERRSVLGAVLGEGLVLVGGALALGLAGAVLVGRLLADMLFGVEPVDPLSLSVAGALIGAAGLLASLLPALRATRIDPVRALTAE